MPLLYAYTLPLQQQYTIIDPLAAGPATSCQAGPPGPATTTLATRCSGARVSGLDSKCANRSPAACTGTLRAGSAPLQLLCMRVAAWLRWAGARTHSDLDLRGRAGARRARAQSTFRRVHGFAESSHGYTAWNTRVFCAAQLSPAPPSAPLALARKHARARRHRETRTHARLHGLTTLF